MSHLSGYGDMYFIDTDLRTRRGSHLPPDSVPHMGLGISVLPPQRLMLWCGGPGLGPGTLVGRGAQDIECSECSWGHAEHCSSVRGQAETGTEVHP